MPGAAPTSSAEVDAAAELVPDRMAAAAAEDGVEHALDETLVALPPDRREPHRPVVGGVVADRGDRVLRDRHLEPDGAADRDHLRVGLRLRARAERRHRERRHAARAAAEGGQEQCDNEHDRQDEEEREVPGPARRTHFPTFDPPPPSGARGRHVSAHRNGRADLFQP